MGIALALSGMVGPVDADDAKEPWQHGQASRAPAYQRHRVGHPTWGPMPAYHRAPRQGPAMHRPPTRFPQKPIHVPTRVSSGAWFQRPYPYHLDYYRMRYGGTYEPYFSGGLYGTPQIIVPPYGW